MNDLAVQIVLGFASGAVYASLALALVMIYRATGDLNFAQGEMATLGGFLATTMLAAGASFWVAALSAAVASALMGALVYLLIVRPIGPGAHTRSVVALLGLYLILNSVMGFVWGHDPRSVASPFPDKLAMPSIGLSAHETGTILVVLFVAAILQALFRYTRWGLAMRAASDHPVKSVYVGIPVQATKLAGWAIAAALGACAGILVAPKVLLEPNMMLGVLIYGFAAALLGGIANPLGATVAGFLVGATENLVGAYVVGAELKLTVTLVLIVAVLVVRPGGLFASASGRRA